MNFLLICFLIACILLTVSSQKKPSVAIVCLMKNNEDILPFWLEYHSALVGVENIVILDNFSDKSSKSPAILQQWEKKGLKVEWNQGPYSTKGDLTYAAYKKHFSTVDIGIPLDIDEVLVGFTNDKPTPTKKAFQEGVQQFWDSKQACANMHQYYTVCCNSVDDTVETIDRAILVNYSNMIAKKMFRIDAITGIDHGNHFVFLSYGECSQQTNTLGLMHYHFRNPKLTIEHALTDLRGFRYIDEAVRPDNAHKYYDFFAMLAQKQVSAFHKAIEVMQFIRHGYTALLHQCGQYESVYLGNSSTIMRQL